MERRGTFDYILLETTGLADPGNLAPIFWVDDNLGSSIYLDGIVTLVDAKNILRLLDEPTPEQTASGHDDADHSNQEGHVHTGPVLSMAHMQISHADVIILNKADLVSSEELQNVRDRIEAINNVAKIHVTDHSETPQIEGVVLDLHAYDHLANLDFAEKGHSHVDPVFPDILFLLAYLVTADKSVKAISTVSIVTPPIPSSKVSRVDAWLRFVLWDSTFPPVKAQTQQLQSSDFEIHRLKGIISLSDDEQSAKIIQAVRDIFEIRDSERPPQSDKAPCCKIVLIGRGLGTDGVPWQQNFEAFLESDE